jgi:hypothetical protein
MKILLKDAKNILALEEKAKLEGKDALDVVDDKNSLFRPLPGISVFVYKTIWMNLMV